MKVIKQMKNFKKILWQDLPDYGLYSEQLIAYIKNNFLVYFPSYISISPNMINNYVKQNIIPKPLNKKYQREHIALLMIVCIFKQVLPIQEIKSGIDLQIKIMGLESTYDEFISILDISIKQITKLLEGKKAINFNDFQTSKKNMSLTFAIQAFCFQVITRYIITIDGLYDKENYE